MEENVKDSFTTEEYVNAFKSGKRFLQKQSETSVNPMYFMQDSEADLIIGKEYSSFEITECKYNPKSHVLSVGADLELTQTAKISVGARLIDLETGTVYAALGQEEIVDSSSLNYHKEVVLSEGAPVVNVDLTVAVVATWQIGSEAGNSVSILKELRGYRYEYEHELPKKETKCRTFPENFQAIVSTGSELPPENMDPDIRGEADNINIALFRQPDTETADVDYLCLFGKSRFGAPLFTIPAAGKLFITNLESSKEIKKAEVNCYIQETKKLGGYYLAASSEVYSQKITVNIEPGNTSISYRYVDPWDEAFCGSGMWKEYTFDYLLQIVLTVSKDSGQEERLCLYVSSKERENNLLKIPCIMIMWGCVAENTHIKVKVKDKSIEKKIQEITAGDVIDLGTGTATVKEKWRGPSDGCVTVNAAGRSLKMSKDHPVMTEKGWKRAEKLMTTDKIMDVSKAFVSIDSIETDTGETQTYNLEYVADNNLLIEHEEYMIAEGFVVGNIKTQNSSDI
ncbi:MAG: hypothetical protein PHY47_13420 [Lachnospiraceae bacterium]|nr:hypothetical protein [Lachnospiraceae bacterium]